ncbi:hypothetical protein TASIC1_0009002400 [Trichoderma asperellum]|uniref:Glycosyl hydrolase family 92 N-terminal domain-containing protein n=1 Tax=Trichoderma asperellum TaxID=101201 RepID=A0A6V8QYD9_TRIAP|nr:hypothetical protein TASIC1_0009002400 [Trichoderma asperellum]
MHTIPIGSALLVLSVMLFAEATDGPENFPRLDATSKAPSYHTNAGNLKYVNPLIGTQGGDPNDNGGMIPSVAPPFAMTRWTPQTRENYISQVPYSNWDDRIHGFQATHQPAIWMGENGHVTLMPGLGDEVQPLFQKRGLAFKKSDESSTPQPLSNLETNARLAQEGPRQYQIPSKMGQTVARGEVWTMALAMY